MGRNYKRQKRNKKRLFSILLVFIICTGIFSSCSVQNDKESAATETVNIVSTKTFAESVIESFSETIELTETEEIFDTETYMAPVSVSHYETDDSEAETVFYSETEESLASPVFEIDETEAVIVGIDYILNTNTKKFHDPSCSSVKQMKEKNKEKFNGNRDDVIERGYVPCKRCNP